VRITVIATGFDTRAVASPPPVKPEEPGAFARSAKGDGSGGWRHRAAGTPIGVAAVRAEGDKHLESDLDIPAFLRRQAD
jgi:hypothetical protein